MNKDTLKEPCRCHRLSIDQLDAITHVHLDLCLIKEHFEGEDQFVGVGAGELAIACQGSIEVLEKEFSFLLERIK
jgi:hypothetical protein